MGVTVKVGTSLTIPLGATGIVVTSSDPRVVQAALVPAGVKLTAASPGKCTITATYGGDVHVSLDVTVVA